ncbi:MAG: phage head-tail connector protein [Limosilactobacillus coleohominis]|nr:phage head-tail connector protein [Limosilactobacillus coleohominis]MDY3702785.1 phage head-tail connector protein [Limosilactobacillus coleohominis]
MATLDDLKTMLTLKSDQQDGILNLIIGNTEQALRFKLELNTGEKLPPELSYIELEVCVRRFNRLKNEGMTSYSQEGESITFNSSDFDDFMDDINLWKRRHGRDVKTLGKLQFFNPYRGDSRANG